MFNKHLQENINDVTGQVALEQSVSARLAEEDEAELKKVHTNARAKENEILIAGEDSIAGQQRRGKHLSEHNRKIFQRAAQDTRASAAHATFIAMLDSMKADLAVLNAKWDEFDEQSREKYGDNYWDEYAKMYLSDEQRDAIAALPEDQQEEAIQKALMDEMLNDDGSVKGKYEGNDVAEGLSVLFKKRLQEAKIEQAKADYEAGKSPAEIEDNLETMDSQSSDIVYNDNVLYGDTAEEVDKASATVDTKSAEIDLGFDDAFSKFS